MALSSPRKARYRGPIPYSSRRCPSRRRRTLSVSPSARLRRTSLAGLVPLRGSVSDLGRASFDGADGSSRDLQEARAEELLDARPLARRSANEAVPCPRRELRSESFA